MINLKESFLEFIGCHGGIVNRILHIIGLILVFIAIIRKNMLFLLLGAAIQESGHFYQYYKTRKKKDSPLKCLKPQLIFAYPIFIIILIYIIFF